jgi:cyclic beta-1,2-glucan synthetase
MGEHGLPLIGTGDWNDGMNRVGEHGRGESVWLGWFLHATLNAFAPIAQARGELALATAWLGHATRLRNALEMHAWDGEWYRRGFFDDGTPLGSAHNDECQIDAIAQSWSVISGAANPARAARAMDRSRAHLLKRDPPLAHAVHAALREVAAGAGIRESLSTRHPRERRQYTHAGRVDRDRVAMLQASRTRHGRVQHAESRPRTRTAPTCSATRSNPTRSPADVYGERRTRARRLDLVHGLGRLAVPRRLEWILGFRLREIR